MKRQIFAIAALTCSALFISGTDVQAGPNHTKHATLVMPKAVAHANRINIVPVNRNNIYRSQVKYGRHTITNCYVRQYRGWNACCWIPAYRCYAYYSPVDLGWYYWCEPVQRFVPITYLSTYPATLTVGVRTPLNVSGPAQNISSQSQYVSRPPQAAGPSQVGGPALPTGAVAVSNIQGLPATSESTPVMVESIAPVTE